MVSLDAAFTVLAATLRHARAVRRSYGRSLLSQLGDLLRLRSVGVGPDDYYKYDLFDRERFPTVDLMKTYRGWRFGKELRRFSDPKIQAIAYHKHVLYRMLESFGLPTPGIRAIYSPRADGFERHRALTTKEQLVDYLSTTQDLPLFGKPSNASHGFGARAFLERVGSKGLRLRSGDVAPITDIAGWIHGVAEQTGTYLLTEMLEPTEQLSIVSGQVLPSFRFVVLMRDGSPEPFVATILFPLAHHDVSNLRGFTTGSVFGKVDIDTGIISRIVASAGPGMRMITGHTETGAVLDGLKIRRWDELVEMVLLAARAMSPFRMQHWDVAMTTRGPVILEMNFIGEIEAMQLHGPPGIFTEQFRTFWETQRVW